MMPSESTAHAVPQQQEKILSVLLDHDACIASWSNTVEISKLAVNYLLEKAKAKTDFPKELVEILTELKVEFDTLPESFDNTVAKSFFDSITLKMQSLYYSNRYREIFQKVHTEDIGFGPDFYHQVGEIFVKNNPSLIEKIIGLSGSYNKVLFSVCSTRHTLYNDILNAYRSDAFYSGSAYHAIPAIANSVKNHPALAGKTVEFVPMLLPDLLANENNKEGEERVKVGQHYDDYCEAIPKIIATDHVKEILTEKYHVHSLGDIEDKNKFSIIYAITNHIANLYPAAQIDAMMFDDVETILDGAHAAVESPEGQRLIPHNVCLITSQYKNGMFTEKQAKTAKGSGEIKAPSPEVLRDILTRAKTSNYGFSPVSRELSGAGGAGVILQQQASNIGSAVGVLFQPVSQVASASAAGSEISARPESKMSEELRRLSSIIQFYIFDSKKSLTSWNGGKDIYISNDNSDFILPVNKQHADGAKHFIVPEGVYKICEILQKAKEDIAKNGNETDILAKALADIKLLVIHKLDNSFANLFAQTFIRTSSTQALYAQILNAFDTNVPSLLCTQDEITPAA